MLASPKNRFLVAQKGSLFIFAARAASSMSSTLGGVLLVSVKDCMGGMRAVPVLSEVLFVSGLSSPSGRSCFLDQFLA